MTFQVYHTGPFGLESCIFRAYSWKHLCDDLTKSRKRFPEFNVVALARLD